LGLEMSAKNAPVAQLDRAPDYESGGQEFESLRARHFINDLAALDSRRYRDVTESSDRHFALGLKRASTKPASPDDVRLHKA
jgi:hypothetical protein